MVIAYTVHHRVFCKATGVCILVVVLYQDGMRKN